MPPSFFKIKATYANPRPRLVRENGAVGAGNAGCESAIKFAMFCKSQGKSLAFLVLMCSNNNDLKRYVNTASKFVSKDRIFACHVALRYGGNGKSLLEGVRNFPRWKHVVERIIPKLTTIINRQGAYHLFGFSSTGGTGSPAIVYFIKLVDEMKLFERKLISIIQARDEASQENEPEIIMRMCKIEGVRIIYVMNEEENPLEAEMVDVANAGIVGSIATNCIKWDTSDFMLRLPKITFLKVGFGGIPYYPRMMFWAEQNHENTLNTTINLLRQVGIKKSDHVITVGDIRPDILKVASEQVQPVKADRAKHDLKIVGVKLKDWNVIVGRLRLVAPQVVSTPNFDLLDSMMGGDDEK